MDDAEGRVEGAEALRDAAGAAAQVQQHAARRDARRRLRDELLHLRGGRAPPGRRLRMLNRAMPKARPQTKFVKI